MTLHILRWLFKSTLTFLVGIPVTLLGMPIVALALPFRVEHVDTDKTFTDPRFASQGTHRLVTLPQWAKPWDNVFDGMWGDKRGWWNNYCLENYRKSCQSFYSMWQWAAIRNPANYYSRVIMGLDVSRCRITKLAGDDLVEELPGKRQWNFLVAVRDDGRHFHRLNCVFPFWFDQNHCVNIDIGWKFKLKHNGTSTDADVQDRIKGSVFGFSPWKKL